MIRVRVRVRPRQVMEELDPRLAHTTASSVPGVRSVELCDERVSDALYVTLDVVADARTGCLEHDLSAALAHLPEMDAFLVVAHGDQVPIDQAAPGDWDAATVSWPVGRPAQSTSTAPPLRQ